MHPVENSTPIIELEEEIQPFELRVVWCSKPI